VALAIVALAALASGCSAKQVPRGALIIDRVDVIGAEKADEDELADRLATSRTRHALGGLLAAIPVLTYFDALTVEYHTLDKLVLERDLQRVRRWYRARGFYDAEVRAGRVVHTEEGHVRVEIVVHEGEPVTIGDVELVFEGRRAPRVVTEVLREVAASYRREPTEDGEEGPRFDEERLDKMKNELRRALTARGYAHAEVTGKAEVDLARARARVRFVVDPGPSCLFGEVTIVGLAGVEDDIPSDVVLDAVSIEPGEMYSSDKLDQAEGALGDLQVFSAIALEPQLGKGKKKTRIPVVVHLSPIKLRGVKSGFGSEVGSRIDFHGVLGWEDRSFVGGLRRFTVDFRPGLVLFPLSASSLFDPPSDVLVLPEAAIDFGFTQPGFPERRANTIATLGARLYRPRTLPEPSDFDSDRDNVVGYRELDGALGVDRRIRFAALDGFSFYGAPFVKIQFDNPFSYNLDAPPDGFNNVLIPYLDVTAALDFRKDRQGKHDPNNAHSGVYLGVNAQLAALGDAEDFKLSPDLRVYLPLGDKVVLAGRWATGFLFARNYGDSLLGDEAASEVDRARDLQLLGFRGYFSGGSSSNRGYGFREVGPHEVLPFLSQVTPSDERLPAGGLGLWEVSGEIRVSVTDDFLGVLFLDASDVVRSLSDFRVNYPHLSPGLGFRYVSQVGSIRFDLGFRPPYLQKIGERYLPPEEGGPEEGEDDSLPLAFHVAIGESF
jgi:outer membrane protein insertion porin family/translocation and assembly module TamA